MTSHATSPASGRSIPASNILSAKRVRGPCRKQFTAAGPGRSAAGSEARRLAAVILEVLAGVQTPTSAALALGIRLPRYYFLEQRALAGLVAACEPRPKGRAVGSDRQIARLERVLAVCRRELGRQQALARAAQRVLGLKVAPVPAVTAGKPGAPGKGQPAKAGTGGNAGKKSRQRKPVVRALRAARVLQTQVLKADCSITGAVGEVQTPAGDVLPAGGGNHQAGTDAACLETQGAQGG
jgi:hypothetical protein